MGQREHFSLSRFMADIDDLTIDEQIERLRDKYLDLLDSCAAVEDSLTRARFDAQNGRRHDPDWLRRARTARRTYGIHIQRIEFSISRLRRIRHLDHAIAARFMAAAKRILTPDLVERIETEAKNRENH